MPLPGAADSTGQNGKKTHIDTLHGNCFERSPLRVWKANHVAQTTQTRKNTKVSLWRNQAEKDRKVNS